MDQARHPHSRTAMTAAVALLAAVTLSVAFQLGRPQPVLAANTNPSATSAASLYTSNWQDMMAIWMASKLNQNDTSNYGPRIGEIHYSANWTTNQIVDYSGFFRDETNARKYDQIHGFNSSGYLDSNGLLNSAYGTYNGATLPVTINRNYAMVPNQPFMVVQYTVSNPGASSITWNVLDQIHLNNTNMANNMHAWYDSGRNALIGDMTASGQYFVVLGAFQAGTSYQVGNDTVSNLSDPTAGPWYQFDANGVLGNNADVRVPNVDMAYQNRVTIGASSSVTLYYYVTVRSTLAAAQSAADTARAQTGSYWLNQSATSWTNWLNAGKRLSSSDTGVNTAFDRNLIVIKDTQHPSGRFPAATNPGAYSYKVWVRDSSFNAMALDASGHTSEAASWWNWMASVQQANGSWKTTFDLWTGNYISFVEPEYDSIGEFLVGVYRHWKITGDTSFLNSIWPAVRAAADFVNNNIQSNGFGPADASIWEENQEYNAFTQALYVAGLRAGAYLAQAQADGTRSDNYSGAASTILSAVQRSYSWSPPGMVNDATRYYDRAVTTGNAPRPLIDASSDALIVFGDVDAASSRAARHMQIVEQALTHDTWGIGRYQGDNYYYTSQYSPAGNEAGSAEPVWPQMSMYAAIYEVFTGQSANAFSRLQWYASRSGVGYMPPGEAVSWVTQQPIVSTMSEPLTAPSFVMASLVYAGQYDTRVTPNNSNAAAYATVNVTTSPATDWPQWRGVPYQQNAAAASQSGATMSHITRVYLSNDGQNVYLRIDNASGALSAFNTAPKFGMLVYAQDFNHSTSLPTASSGMYGRALDRPMNYLAGRWSDSSTFSHFTAASGGSWSWDYNITSIAPQWDTSTGRVEMAIPISALASGGSAPSGSWTFMDVELAYQNPSTGTWQDDDLVQIHYQLASSGQAWLYGNTLDHEIVNVSTDKTRYTTGAATQIYVDLVNPQAVSRTSTVTLHFTHLGSSAASDQSTSVTLTSGQPTRSTFNWSPTATNHQGYLIQAVLTDGSGNILDNSQTAIDVSNDWTYFPRYGYVSFFPDDYSSSYVVQQLDNYHLDVVQFYDWQWKQHVPLAGSVSNPAASWMDIGNRTNYRRRVLDLLNSVHGAGSIATNYNLIYGALNGYGQDGSGVDYHWGLWWNTNCTNQVNISLSPGMAYTNIYVFNPANGSWQSYINGRESDAFAAYGFDAWHGDQLGDQGTTYDCNGSAVNLANTFSGFLTSANAALGKPLIFNAVGQYGQQQIATNSSLAFLYTECWPANGQTTYNDLRTTVTNSNTWSNGTKASVLAAYVDSTYQQSFTDTAPGFFSDPGVLLADASTFASGGAHIELGDGDHMLDNPYFPNEHLLMRGSLQQAMRNYYDFFVAYENALRDGLTDSSNAVVLPGIATSTNGQAGTVWAYARSKTGLDVLQLINLLNNTSVNWQDANANYPAPTIRTNVTVKYYYGTGAPTAVSLASPDSNGGVAQSLSFTTGSDGSGNYIQFTVPSLNYWDTVMVSR